MGLCHSIVAATTPSSDQPNNGPSKATTTLQKKNTPPPDATLSSSDNDWDREISAMTDSGFRSGSSAEQAEAIAQNVNKKSSAELAYGYDEEAASMMERGLALHKQGKRELALQMLSLSRQRIRGPENPQLAALHMYSGAILFECEAYREAISHFRSAYTILKSTLGAGDPNTIVAEQQVQLTFRKLIRSSGQNRR